MCPRVGERAAFEISPDLLFAIAMRNYFVTRASGGPYQVLPAGARYDKPGTRQMLNGEVVPKYPRIAVRLNS